MKITNFSLDVFELSNKIVDSFLFDIESINDIVSNPELRAELAVSISNTLRNFEIENKEK